MKNKLGVSLTLISLMLFCIGLYVNNQDVEIVCLLFAYIFFFASIPVNLYNLPNKL